MATLGWLGWRSIWAHPKGGEAATVPCIHDSTYYNIQGPRDVMACMRGVYLGFT